ncbi:glycosyltransferase family 87 protein [Novosphingobium sp. PS1R-30]|uniref:Glycosyltransferase family 87 protein n=1 Tax=Novosphingobium anseongense TaxID=3133436 RepID=A0ABU8RR64_9SPHN
MTSIGASTPDRGYALRIALALVVAGLVVNGLIVRLWLGGNGRILFYETDRLADFVKHTMSFPGGALAPSFYPELIAHFQSDIEIFARVHGHFHNMPETVLLTLAVRPLFSLIDPIVLYMIFASLCVLIWASVCHRHADAEARPYALGLALANYPLLLMLDRGNLFSAITAICLAVALLRKRQDWLATMLIAVAVNIRPNVAVIVLPLLAWDRATFAFVARTFIVGVVLGFGSLAIDNVIYPAYTLQSWLRGLQLYNDTYTLGRFGTEYGSSLWGALRHVLPVTGRAVVLCMLAGLLPLVLAWLWRNRLSYAASCFLAMAACALSTAVFGDYHLLIFLVPLLILRREDPAFWPILLGACWVLTPKNYTPNDVLSWQVFLNPAGTVLAVLGIAQAYRNRVYGISTPHTVEGQS